MKVELTVAEYAAREGITRSAVYERKAAGTIETKQTGLNHWKKPKYVILVDSEES